MKIKPKMWESSEGNKAGYWDAFWDLVMMEPEKRERLCKEMKEYAELVLGL